LKDYFFSVASAIDLFLSFFLDVDSAEPEAPPFWQQDPPAEVVPLLQQDPLFSPLLHDFSVLAFDVALASVVTHLAPVLEHSFSQAAFSASVQTLVSCFPDALVSVLDVCACETTPKNATRAITANSFFISVYFVFFDFLNYTTNLYENEHPAVALTFNYL
jgi:CBS domain containing-hemolysin-like protein